MTAYLEIEGEASVAFRQGFRACQEGDPQNTNPYLEEAGESSQRREWDFGWHHAHDQNINFDFVRRQVAMPPEWSQAPIKPWEAVYNREASAFVSHEYWSDTGSVNVFRVVGTMHQQYQGKTWLQFLLGGKRMQHNLQRLMDNPDYYLHPVIRQPKIDFYTVDGLDYYVGSDGNHRTCLARFFLDQEGKSQLHEVTVHHHHLDQAFLHVYHALQASIREHQVAKVIWPDRRLLGRDDTAGWKVDRFEPFLMCRDLDTGQEMELNQAQAHDMTLDLAANGGPAKASTRPSLWRRLFGAGGG
ncbi:ribosome modulation factor [Halomonas elongata]|uniref:Uncharacterized protein n=2 Tax=Halomonas elongata TaxID=2746 RepID=E1VA57_HALED|nr:hypothetical protein [Halomonas elongata]WPU46527.1 hypothetical protein SR933_14900 [Halomonas elongata DSM 2581]CBV43945.1 uncharacterized protein HELO_4061 [Halomonas elongata DSM 2581]